MKFRVPWPPAPFSAPLAFSLVVAVSAAVFALIQDTRPQPFMDEIFHVPQAQRYCRGLFKEWDDKITTLPGLYFISIGVLTPLAHAYTYVTEGGTGGVRFSGEEPLFCSTGHLRAINLLLSSVTILILNKLTLQIHGNKHYFDEGKCLLSAVNLSVFPVLYFFSFFYYTDVGSTFLVLFMYCLALERKDWMASFIGLLAVSFRQSNIVWVAFVAVQSVAPVVIHAVHVTMLEQPRPHRWSLTTSGQLRELVEGLPLLLRNPWRTWRTTLEVLAVGGGYLLVWMVFVAFLVWNEGIVVGDRSAHVAVFHPTQVLYFLAFTLALTAPFNLLGKARAFLAACRHHYVLVALLIVLVIGVVDSYTLAHPYLLADNRHLTFYFWRRVVTATAWSKYALVPLYVYGGFCVLHTLRKAPFVFRLTFPVFAVAALTPQLLLEFRYFIVPFLLYRLQLRPTSWVKLAAEMALYVAINAFTVLLFVFKPFRWAHDPEDVQRIIW